MKYAIALYCRIFVIMFIGLVNSHERAFGVEPPVLSEVKIMATTELDSASDIYSYAYSFSNPPTNTGQIWSIQVEMLKSETGADVGKEGIEHEPGAAKIIEPIVTKDLAKKGKVLVPVGLYSPRGWLSGPSVFGTVGWGGGDKSLILPGNTVSGFRMISRGLPGIRDITIYPRRSRQRLGVRSTPLT